MSTRPLPSVVQAGHPARAREVTGTGVLGQRPGGPRVFVLDGWATMSHPQRVRVLRELAEEYGRDPMWASMVVGKIFAPMAVQPRDWPNMAAALLGWTQQSVFYANEKDERLQAPWRTLELGVGDCDDMALLLATLATSIDLPNRYMLVGRERSSGLLVRWIEGTPMPKAWANGKAVEWFHIANVLGWPTGGAGHRSGMWLEAEPTLRGAPLGYSLVRHGVVADRHGRLFVPPAAKAPGALEPYRGLPPNGGVKRAQTSGDSRFMGSLASGGALAGVPVQGMTVQTRPLRERAAAAEGPTLVKKYGQIAVEAAVGGIATFLAVGAFEAWTKRRKRRQA